MSHKMFGKQRQKHVCLYFRGKTTYVGTFLLDDVGDVSIHENIRGFDITQITSDRFLARPPAHRDYQALPGDVTPTQLGIGVPAQL